MASPAGEASPQVPAQSSIDASIANPNTPHPPSSNEGSVIEAGDGESVESDEFDPQEWDDTNSNASTSITSSVYQHTYAHGRRYHSYKNGRYPVPNDDMEQSREDMKHAMMMEITGLKLHYAPIGEYPQKILDIGTGTGIWAIEAGDKYPSASVLGLDLSPIQPLWLPPNVKFVIDDCEDEWMNGDNWDLVHLRGMSPILRDMPRMCKQSFDNIKPGGWIEWQDFHASFRCDDGTMPEDDPAHVVYRMAADAFKKMGFSLSVPCRLGKMLQEAGFVNIQCVVKKIPVGPWARDKKLRLVGSYLKTVIQEFMQVLAAKPFLLLGLNQVERELWKTAGSKALEDMCVHRYWNFYFWYAQKPE